MDEIRLVNNIEAEGILNDCLALLSESRFPPTHLQPSKGKVEEKGLPKERVLKSKGSHNYKQAFFSHSGATDSCLWALADTLDQRALTITKDGTKRSFREALIPSMLCFCV